MIAFFNIYVDKILSRSRSSSCFDQKFRTYGKMDIKGAIWERPKPRKLRTS